jgi:hypothetical protein
MTINTFNPEVLECDSYMGTCYTYAVGWWETPMGVVMVVFAITVAIITVMTANQILRRGK